MIEILLALGIVLTSGDPYLQWAQTCLFALLILLVYRRTRKIDKSLDQINEKLTQLDRRLARSQEFIHEKSGLAAPAELTATPESDSFPLAPSIAIKPLPAENHFSSLPGHTISQDDAPASGSISDQQQSSPAAMSKTARIGSDTLRAEAVTTSGSVEWAGVFDPLKKEATPQNTHSEAVQEASTQPGSEPEKSADTQPGSADPDIRQEIGTHVQALHELAADLPAFLTPFVRFIKRGNAWAMIGIFLLLLGFGFLINYMAEQGILSLEMRIAGTAICGLVLVGFGISLRDRKREYALVLQGGGIGIVYLSAYAATKMTDLLSPLSGLVFISILLVPAIGLAIVQNAQILALFAFSGGFAAPVLLSDGSGNFVGLFSYYLLLSCGIAAISRWRRWPWLNVVGAGWTFAVFGLWMVTSYQPDMFWQTQPFLALFLLIYAGLGITACHRDGNLADPVKAALVLGVPALAICFQWYIARSQAHGLSLSCLAYGAAFVLVGGLIHKRFSRARYLSEGYLVTGLGLANLAIPLEFSGSTSSAAWAMEAVVFHYLAGRMHTRRYALVAGVFLVAACLFLFRDFAYRSSPYPVVSGGIVAAALLVMAWLEKRDGPQSAPDGLVLPFVNLADVFSGLCLIIWYVSLAVHCWSLHIPATGVVFLGTPYSAGLYTWHLFFVCACVSALAFFAIAKFGKLVRLTLAQAVLFLLSIVQALVWLPESMTSLHGLMTQAFLVHAYLGGMEGLGWAAFALAQTAFLLWNWRKLEEEYQAFVAGWLSLTALLVLTSTLRAAVYTQTGSFVWLGFAGILPGLLFVVATSFIPKKIRLSPLLSQCLVSTVPAVVFGLLSIWLVLGLFETGDPAPLPYIPLLNPLELQQAATLLVFLFWQMQLRKNKALFAVPIRYLVYVLDLMVFVWLHSVIIRTIHFVTGASFSMAIHEKLFKVLLTTLWGLFGLAHIYIGNKFRLRKIWVAGAFLVAADCAKLFLFDFVEKGTLFHIASFFVMGTIFLLIGLFAPLPPATADSGHKDADKATT